MTEHPTNTEARERVLAAAERLFAQKGYATVTLRDIAAEVGIRHASLYHHIPGGKEALFIEVTERMLERHRSGLLQALSAAEPTIYAQLCAAADWLLSQPPLDLLRMVHADMPSIATEHAQRLEQLSYAAMIEPLELTLIQAQQRGEVQLNNAGLVAGGLLGMLEALHAVPEYALEQSRSSMAYELIDVLLHGLLAR